MRILTERRRINICNKLTIKLTMRTSRRESSSSALAKSTLLDVKSCLSTVLEFLMMCTAAEAAPGGPLNRGARMSLENPGGTIAVPSAAKCVSQQKEGWHSKAQIGIATSSAKTVCNAWQQPLI
jgi:hypothetical protein